MKSKIIITVLSSLLSISLHAQIKILPNVSEPPILAADKAYKSMAIKVKDSTVFSKCNGFPDSKPVPITSSTGAKGYYCQCTVSNAVIFYLVNQKVSVFNYGDIRTKYATQDFERGPLGFPLHDVKGIAGLRGGYQVYEGGCIYLIFHATPDKKSSAAFIIKEDFYKKFLALGGDKAIGLPISDEEDDKSAGGEAGDKFPMGIISQSFEKGIITKKASAMAYTSYSSKPPIRTPGNKENTPAGKPPIRTAGKKN